MNTPTLKTERLILRKFHEKDINALYMIFHDIDVNKFLPWFPLQSKAEAVTFYNERYASVYKQPNGYHYAICLKQDDIPIGYVNVGMDDSHDLGYGLCKTFWHKGIVREAITAVIEQVKNDGLHYITATHDIHNPRSGKVMKAVGMQYEYSYEELWQPKNILVTFRMYQMNFDQQNDYIYRGYWNIYKKHFIENIITE